MSDVTIARPPPVAARQRENLAQAHKDPQDDSRTCVVPGVAASPPAPGTVFGHSSDEQLVSSRKVPLSDRRASGTPVNQDGRTSRPVSRVLSRPLPAGATIHLGPPLPAASCGLPGGSGEQPSNASADARTRPFDLAPGGVYRATPVTWDAGGLLHHRFTLTAVR